MRAFLINESTFATTLHTIALKIFGADIYGWEPEMFDLEFRDELDVNVPPLNQEKLISLILSISTNTYYEDPQVFTVFTEILNGNEADFTTLTPDLLPAEMAWAITELKLSDETQPFSTDVATYAGVILGENGFFSPPPSLSFATIPPRYLGSTPGEEIDQMKAQNLQHNRIIESYISEQSTELFNQIQTLPWVNEKILSDLSEELVNMRFSS